MKKIDTIIKWIKGIFSIEILAVIIALLQLIIAMPQLKLAFESSRSNDIKELQNTINSIDQRSKKSSIMPIPLDCKDTEVCYADSVQKELLLAVNIISTADFTAYPTDDEELKELELARFLTVVSIIDNSIELCREVIANKNLIDLSTRLVSLKTNELDGIINALQDMKISEPISTEEVQRLLYSKEFRTLLNEHSEYCLKFVSILNNYKLQYLNRNYNPDEIYKSIDH